MKYLALFLLLLCSCATYNYRNINVYDRQVDTNLQEYEMKQLIDYAYGVIDPRYHFIFKDWDFVFTSAWLGKKIGNNEVAIADGLTDVENKVIFLKVHKCHWDNAIVHEMHHVIQWFFEGTLDYEHEELFIWGPVREREKEMLKRCPPGYKRSNEYAR